MDLSLCRGQASFVTAKWLNILGCCQHWNEQGQPWNVEGNNLLPKFSKWSQGASLRSLFQRWGLSDSHVRGQWRITVGPNNAFLSSRSGLDSSRWAPLVLHLPQGSNSAGFSWAITHSPELQASALWTPLSTALQLSVSGEKPHNPGNSNYHKYIKQTLHSADHVFTFQWWTHSRPLCNDPFMPSPTSSNNSPLSLLAIFFSFFSF